MIRDVKIDDENCIGCGGCEQNCSGVFTLTHRVHAKVKNRSFETQTKKILSAYYGCPVNCIEVVSDDPSHQITWHTARMASKTMLSETAMEVRLACDTSAEFIPGQFVTVRFKDDVGYFNRAYSIVEYGGGEILLSVTLMHGGRGSSFFSLYEPGCEVEITDPKGDFQLKTITEPKCFVATGAGLAPMVSMIEQCPEAKKTLYFGQRKEGDLFYLDRLAKVPNLEIKVCLDFADDDWTGFRGRVTDQIRLDPIPKETEVYTCGSPAMMKDLESVLKKKRHSRHLFFKESFISTGVDVSMADLTWRRWVRNVHIYLSMLLCILFLFFGFTGFVANRPEWFQAEAGESVPQNIALNEGELGAFFKGQLGTDFQVADYSHEDGYAILELQNAEQMRCVAEVNAENRNYSLVKTFPLSPAAKTLEADQLVQELAANMKGKLEMDSLEVDGDTLYFNLDSVWGLCAVEVDLDAGEYQVNREAIPWIKALVLLHKGKQAGVLQRVLIDLAGLGMVLVALTGMIMAFRSSVQKTRILSVIMAVLGSVILVLMAIGR